MESASEFQHILIINIIDCSRYCSGQFRVAKADENIGKSGEKGGEENDEADGEESSEEGVENGKGHSEEWDEEKGQDNDKEIISPASYVDHFFV